MLIPAKVMLLIRGWAQECKQKYGDTWIEEERARIIDTWRHANKRKMEPQQR
jgi:hypothetical protein